MGNKRTGMTLIKPWLLAIALAAVQIFGVIAPAHASDLTEAQGLVDRAKATFNDFMADSNYSWLHDHLKEAKGVLIFPQVIKGGFFIGGSGGSGLLAVRDEKTGDWSQPAFYTIGSVSFGLQIGGEAAEVVMMVMDQKGIDSLLSSSIKLGGSVSIALGPVGAGAKGTVTADIISFARSKGLYAGLDLVGSVLEVRDSLNNAYYGKKVRPVAIVIERKVSNPESAGLLAVLRRAAR
ncbi:hypothetical protein GURASL_19250 [Geotalea uraniireducens]|uniref:Ysc84 actin-binding domain-containing protein n=1 Tax=Geotalea uraniireducens TaxID=351604 RepID=A0ABM8ELV2_9BACT|nr:lipid-binding SYLF domain-containing protein [Geotalea uraniireducens]BDV43002.1 hypothetical protein GURASL_19250 [Geotalea uraniireducens]